MRAEKMALLPWSRFKAWKVEDIQVSNRGRVTLFCLTRSGCAVSLLSLSLRCGRWRCCRRKKRRELALTANLTQSYWLPTRRFTTTALGQGNIGCKVSNT